MRGDVGNMPPLPRVFPDCFAPAALGHALAEVCGRGPQERSGRFQLNSQFSGASCDSPQGRAQRGRATVSTRSMVRGMARPTAGPSVAEPSATRSAFPATRIRLGAVGRLDRLQLPSGDYSALLQPVANHVGWVSEIKPRREGTAESRLQLIASAPKLEKRGAARLHCCWRSISAKVVGEIECGFFDLQQRLGRSPLGINHVMAFELDVEELQFVVFARLIAGDVSCR
jgi:hypothetical protein